MDDSIFKWLQAKLEENDPVSGGNIVLVVDAVRHLECFLERQQGMVFGLALPPGCDPVRVEALLDDARARSAAWVRAVGEAEARASLSPEFSRELLTRIGIASPSVPEVVVELVCEFAAELDRNPMQAEAGADYAIRDTAILSLLDGVTPCHGVECPEALGWAIDERLALRFDEARSELVAEVVFACDREVDDTMMEEARRASAALWKSAWALNIAWALPEIPGIAEDDCPTVLVSGSVLRVRARAPNA